MSFPTASLTPLTPATYYRHSGKVPPAAGVAGLLGAVFGGLIIGGIYGFLGLFAHMIPVGKLMFLVEILLTMGAGALLGLVPVALLKRFNARSMLAAMGSALIAFCVAYYAAWVFWFYALDLYAQWQAPLSDIAKPQVLIEMIGAEFDQGIWGAFDKDATKGWFLVIIWVVEAGMLLFIALQLARKRMNASVFCENCNRWGTRRHLMLIRDETLPALLPQLAAGDIQAFANAAPHRDGDARFCNVELEGCANCDTLQTLNVTHTVVTADKKGRTTTKNNPVVKRQLLTPEQTAQLALIAASHASPGINSGDEEESEPSAVSTTSPAPPPGSPSPNP